MSDMGYYHRTIQAEQPVKFRVVEERGAANDRKRPETVLLEIEGMGQVKARRMMEGERIGDFQYSDYILSPKDFYVICGKCR